MILSAALPRHDQRTAPEAACVAAQRSRSPTEAGVPAGTFAASNTSGLSAATAVAHLHGPADVEGSADVLQVREGSLGTEGNVSGALTLTDSQWSDVVVTCSGHCGCS
jgi:hypothetical protein